MQGSYHSSHTAVAGNILFSLSCANIFRVLWLCKGRLFDPAFGTWTRRRDRQTHTWGQHSPVCTLISIPVWPTPALAPYRCGWGWVGTHRSPGGKPQYLQHTERPVTWTKDMEPHPQPQHGTGTWEGASSIPSDRAWTSNTSSPEGSLVNTLEDGWGNLDSYLYFISFPMGTGSF